MKSLRGLFAVTTLGVAVMVISVAPAVAGEHAQASHRTPAVVGAAPLPAPASIVKKLHRISRGPLNNACARYNNIWTIYGSKCTDPQDYSCTPYNKGGFPYNPQYLSNGCNTRVWIYQGPGQKGRSLCISADTSTSLLKLNYSYGWVSANKSRC